MKYFLSILKPCLRLFLGVSFGIWVFVWLPASDAAGPQGTKIQDVSIQVRETSLVQDSEILLGEIAQIQAGPFLKEILQTMEVGNAPKPGKIKQLNKNHLASLIGAQPGMPEGAVIKIPEKVYVKRSSQQIQQQAIQDQVDLFLSDYFKDRDYELEQLTVKELGLYPQGKVDLSGISNSNIDSHGNLSLVMDIVIEGKQEDRIRISGKVAVYENLLCAKRNLAKGEQLLEKDVQLVRNNLFDLRGDGVRTAQGIEGKLLKTSIKKNEPIKLSDLQEIPLIQKGDVITLVARSNNILIVTSGISQEDGYADKLIRVENIESGKIVRGLVKEKSTVEVTY